MSIVRILTLVCMVGLVFSPNANATSIRLLPDYLGTLTDEADVIVTAKIREAKPMPPDSEWRGDFLYQLDDVDLLLGDVAVTSLGYWPVRDSTGPQVGKHYLLFLKRAVRQENSIIANLCVGKECYSVSKILPVEQSEDNSNLEWVVFHPVAYSGAFPLPMKRQILQTCRNFAKLIPANMDCDYGQYRYVASYAHVKQFIQSGGRTDFLDASSAHPDTFEQWGQRAQFAGIVRITHAELGAELGDDVQGRPTYLYRFKPELSPFKTGRLFKICSTQSLTPGLRYFVIIGDIGSDECEAGNHLLALPFGDRNLIRLTLGTDDFLLVDLSTGFDPKPITLKSSVLTGIVNDYQLPEGVSETELEPVIGFEHYILFKDVVDYLKDANPALFKSAQPAATTTP